MSTSLPTTADQSRRQLSPTEQKINTVRATLMAPAMMEQLRMALPKHVTPERLARIVLTELRRVPKLAECTHESLFGAIMTCAQLGLEPGVLGQAWIVPFWNSREQCNEATLIVGYRGMVGLAWRSAQIKSVQAHVVYDGDAFEWAFGLDPKLFHKPAHETLDPKEITHAYAVVHTTAGGVLFDVMTRDEVELIRQRSRAKDSGPWTTDYAEMAKKTVLRRLLKLAPASVEMQRALHLDEQADRGEPQAFAPMIDLVSARPEAGAAAVGEPAKAAAEECAHAEGFSDDGSGNRVCINCGQTEEAPSEAKPAGKQGRLV